MTADWSIPAFADHNAIQHHQRSYRHFSQLGCTRREHLSMTHESLIPCFLVHLVTLPHRPVSAFMLIPTAIEPHTIPVFTSDVLFAAYSHFITKNITVEPALRI
jgi:hypothetical protein